MKTRSLRVELGPLQMCRHPWGHSPCDFLVAGGLGLWSVGEHGAPSGQKAWEGALCCCVELAQAQLTAKVGLERGSHRPLDGGRGTQPEVSLLSQVLSRPPFAICH